MAEELNNQTKEKHPNYSAPDWYLQDLVGFVNKADIEFPITLFTNGLVVTGYLASGKSFFEGLGNQFETYFSGLESDKEDVVKYFTQPGDIYKSIVESSDSQPPPIFIHVRKAQVFSPGSKPLPEEGAWWRGRLSDINGFHFGALAVSA